MSHTNTPRVLHIASGDLWAGAEAQLYTLAKTLHNQLAVPVSAVLMNHGVLEQRLKYSGIPVTTLDESKLNGFQILFRMYKTIKVHQPDVIHTHRNKENILGSIAALLAGGIPSIRTVHGDSEHNYPWWRILENAIQILNRLTGKYLQYRIIAVSNDLSVILGEQYPKDKIRVIENGLDSEELGASKHGNKHERSGNSKAFRIGFAGRLVPVKRIDLILETARYLNECHPDADIEFRIFGEGPLRRELEEQSRKTGVMDLVHFLGNSDSLPEDLRELDALILTSDHEGLPMILLESMALKVPVIAHAVGGIPELLDQGSCGLLVHKQDARAYAKAILELASSPRECRDLSENALRRVNEHYSAGRNARAYLAEYRNHP